MELNYNVFISYRGTGSGGLLGKEIYTDLKHCLAEDNEIKVVPFFAPACIQKGENFKETIRAVISRVSCVILILSPGFFQKCSEEDDMVLFELQQALKNPDISFVPVVMEGFSFDEELCYVNGLFSDDEIYRFKHINAVNHHGIYDFNTEADVLPAVRKAIEEKSSVSSKTAVVRFDLSEFRIDGKRIVSFGRYPQMLLKDEYLVHRIYEGLANNTTKKKENRYEFEGKAYYNICENRFNKRTFEVERADGSYNFYCVEPIEWIVLYANEKYLILISRNIIDARMFNLDRNMHRNGENNQIKQSNDWEVSYIRRWLNNEFYYDSFSESERNYIQYSQISNAASTCYPAFAQDRADTLDKVFLISHEEIYTVGGGCARVSDYARARGAYASTSATCDRFGDWWTRSPGNVDCSVENVDRRGCLEVLPFCNYVNDTAAGVRPCIIVDRGAFSYADPKTDDR